MPGTEIEPYRPKRLIDPLSRVYEYLPPIPYREGITIQHLASENSLNLHSLGVKVWATVDGVPVEPKDWPTFILRPGMEVNFLHAVEDPVTLIWIAASIILTAINIYMARGQKTDLGDSPTYNWGDIQTTTRHGQPIPTVFGEHKVGGQYINVFQSVDSQGESALSALICFGEGELKAIAGKERGGAPDDMINLDTYGSLIEVNGVTADNIPDLEISIRHGYRRQKVVGGFEDLVVQQNVGVECAAFTLVKVTTQEKAQGLELIFSWPEGLFYQGQILHAYTVPYFIFLRRLDGYYGNPEVNGFVNGSLLLTGMDNWIGKAYSIKKKQTSPFTSSVKIDGLPAGIYEIGVYRNWVYLPPSSGFHSKMILQTVNLKTYGQGLSYPKRALMGVHDLPSENLNGSLPNFAVTVKGIKIWVWTDGSVDDPWFTKKYSTNPAWIAFNMLTNSRFGSGRFNTLCDIDLQSFSDWADYCDELIDDGSGTGATMKRWEIGINFDTQKPVWDQCQVIAAAGRAVLVKTGRKVKAKVDRDSSPVQVFGLGNIVKDSFKLSYSPSEDKSNQVEIQFLNADSGFAQDFAAQQSTDQNQLPKKRSESLYGITKAARAYRAAKYLLNREQNDRKSVEFIAPIDSIASEPFDVVLVGHDMPNWGYVSGRIYQNAGSTTITLNRDLFIFNSFAPVVTVRTSATGVDVLQNNYISEPDGFYTRGTVLNVGNPWAVGDLPKQGDIFVLNNVADSTTPVGKKFRITEIERFEDTTARIQAIEHNPDNYLDDPGVLDHLSGEPKPSPFTLPPDVTGLTAQVLQNIDPGGIVSYSVLVGWSKPNFIGSYKNRVYIKLTSNPSVLGGFEFVGETDGTGFQIPSSYITLGEGYAIAVTSVSIAGSEKDPEDAPEVSITIIDPNAAVPPPNVVGLIASQPSPDQVKLTWLPVSFGSLAGYEIRIGRSASGTPAAAAWQDGIVLGQVGKDVTSFIATQFHPGYNCEFMVKAFSQSGKYSATMLSLTVATVLGPWTAGTNVSEQTAWTGSQYGFTTSGGKLIQDMASRFKTWASSTYAWSAAKAQNLIWSGLRSVYERTTSYDFGSVVSRFICIEAELELADYSPTWAQAQYPWATDNGPWTASAASSDGSPFTVEYQISLSNDNVAFGAYQTFQNGLYTCRSFKVKLVVTASHKKALARFNRLEIQGFTP